MRVNRREKLPWVIAGIIVVVILLNFLPNKIAVITLDRGIFTQEEITQLSNAIDTVEKDPTIRAVVFNINSPGSSAAAAEEIYFRVLQLKKVKPIVVSFGEVGASGAYYISAPANFILAKPASQVGSIGLIATLPKEIEDENVIVSGPFKIKTTKESVVETVDILKNEFVTVVLENRAGRLKINPIDLSTGEVWIGTQAKELGLIDEIGSLSDAIKKAEQLSKLPFSRTTTINPFEKKVVTFKVDIEQLQANSTTVPLFYYVYLNFGESG